MFINHSTTLSLPNFKHSAIDPAQIAIYCSMQKQKLELFGKTNSKTKTHSIERLSVFVYLLNKLKHGQLATKTAKFKSKRLPH